MSFINRFPNANRTYMNKFEIKQWLIATKPEYIDT